MSRVLVKNVVNLYVMLNHLAKAITWKLNILM